jgi:hypothetical protein
MTCEPTQAPSVRSTTHRQSCAHTDQWGGSGRKGTTKATTHQKSNHQQHGFGNPARTQSVKGRIHVPVSVDTVHRPWGPRSGWKVSAIWLRSANLLGRIPYTDTVWGIQATCLGAVEQARDTYASVSGVITAMPRDAPTVARRSGEA